MTPPPQRHRYSVIVATLALVCAAAASAAPLPRADVPEPLRPWIDWVLRGHEAQTCASFQGDPERRQCAWPSRLELVLDDRGGTFAQTWELQREAWVDLPGDATHAPQASTADGTAAVLVVQGGVPRVHLEPGRHTLRGRFEWDRLPEALPIPAATGLLDLTLNGAVVGFPNRDAGGRLWLQRRDTSAEADDSLDATMQRAVIDGVPLVLVSRLRLDVAGKGREIAIGPMLPAGFTPMAIDSPLPARLEASGQLRLQVRPGRWMVEIRARHQGPAATLTAPRIEPPLALSEVWVFEAQPELRLVSIEGVDSIDPQQTELPDDWRQLPAYRLRPEDSMRLVERRRGAEPVADLLTLQRTLWLDFDGGGYSVRDALSGTLASATHLDMAPPTVLGRVAVSGVDTFITRMANDAPAGVELRPGPLDLDADSRIEGATSSIPAVSWAHDMQGLSGQLQLPPGWRLLHATGVDQAYPTWIETWTLLDLFVVLIIALGAARLFGWMWGAVTLAAVGLSYTEPGAPGWIWIAVLALEALARAVPPGRWQLPIRFARLGALAVLAVVVVSFAIGQIRLGVYPALEMPWNIQTHDAVAEFAPAAPVAQDYAGEPVRMKAAGGDRDEALEAPMMAARKQRVDLDPRAIVQTGPGMPSWTWNAVSLNWSGPVQRDQQLDLWLIPPWLNLLLAIARTVLLAAIVVMLVRGWRWFRFGGAGAAAVVLLIVSMPLPGRADVPPTEMLDELRTRLLEPPDCHPVCASFPRLRLEVDAARVRARLAVDVASTTAVPLPGQATHWLPTSVVVDGSADTVLSQSHDGVLWLYLDAGRHDVALEGPLPARDTVQIPLPLAPLWVEAKLDGWTLDGLHENGVADASLQLNRTAPAAASEAAAPLRTDQLSGFARVERTLDLGLTWQVRTSVTRLTPLDSALVLAVPLLPGEAVTTAGVRVVDGEVQINLPPNVGATGWESTLAEAPTIALEAPDAVAWVEAWRLDAATIWHIDADGLAPLNRVHAGAAPLEWRPWPGESLTLTVTRPQGVEGQTLTIDRSQLSVSPGLRATDVTLALTLRSSRGTQHTLTLPEGATLQSVAIDGAVQPIAQEGRRVVLPLRPASQQVELRWSGADGITTMLRTPEVDVGAASVNAHLDVTMPANRWTLFAGGPRVGPAVLFWSVLPVLLLVALGLGRITLTPLRAHHWFLLGIGLTQVEVGLSVIVVGWLLALGWRRDRGHELGTIGFDLLQLLLAAWTVVALGILVTAIQRGLLGTPDMQIAGNGSSAEVLRWYADRTASLLPRAWVFSVPLLVYRLLMLAWALWLAQALLRWLVWAWQTYGSGGFWRPLRRRSASAGPAA